MSFINWSQNKSFYKKALIIALPLMFQQLITASVNLVDNLMVGQLGDASIAGVAAANRFYIIATFAIFGIEGASNTFMAQYFGAKDHEHVKQSYRFAIIAAYVIVTPFILLGLFFPQQILQLFTPDLEVIHEGSSYLRAVVLSYAFIAYALPTANAMRALGETKIPMVASIIAILTNAFFNYIFIFGHLGFEAMGVVGAAYGTLIARFVEMALIVIVVKVRPFIFNSKLKEIFIINKKLAKAMIIKGIPLTINEILWSSGMSVLFIFYATRGKEVMAGMSISGSMGDLFFTLFSGMAVATTVLISQTLGANRLDQAKEDAYKLVRLSLMMSLVMGVLLFTSTYFIPQLYNVSEYSRQTAMNYSRIQALMFWIYMMSAQAFFILRAGGDTKSTMLMDSVFMWCVNIPVVGFTAYYTNLDVIGMFIAGNLTDIIKVFISYYYLRQGKWLKNLTHTHEESLLVEL